MRRARNDGRRDQVRRGDRLWPAIAGAGLTLAIPPLTLAALDSLHTAHCPRSAQPHDADCRAPGLIGYYSGVLESGEIRPFSLASR